MLPITSTNKAVDRERENGKDRVFPPRPDQTRLDWLVKPVDFRFSSSAMSDQAASSHAAKRLDFSAVVPVCEARKEELQTLLHYSAFPSDKALLRKDSKPSVWIEAEPGVGKSWLLQEFRKELETSHQHETVLMQGKFEQRAAASEPFATLREAMEDFVQGYLLLPSYEEFRLEWAQGLKADQRTFGAFQLLWNILPELRPAFDEDEEPTCTRQPNESSTTFERRNEQDANPFGDFSSREYRFERFRVAFRNMIRFTCQMLQKENKTLVMILDDFHWIDPDSMLIVKSLLQDEQKPCNFFLLTATRPRETHPIVLGLYATLMTAPVAPDFSQQIKRHMSIVPASSSRVAMETCADKDKNKTSTSTCTDMTTLTLNNHSTQMFNRSSPATKSQSIRPEKRSSVPPVQMLELPRLSSRQIAHVLRSILQASETDNLDEVDRLAKIVESETCGNFFVVMQFLRMLERSGHIMYSEDQNRWSFNIDRILNVDWRSEEVSNTVSATLEAGSRGIRSALMIAAAFGVSQFDTLTIVHATKIVENAGKDGKETVAIGSDYEDPVVVKGMVQEMNDQLREAVADGFVLETSPGHFRFAHDRIRESAYSLLQREGLREEVHLKIGRQLRLWIDTQEERKCKFRDTVAMVTQSV